MNQIELHKKIDLIIAAGHENALVDDVRSLVTTNHDAYVYFYSRADESWLDWLWEHGFLNKIKEKAEDTTRYRYTMPELDYLVHMAEKDPEKVVNIMLQVKNTSDHFNPEVIDRFLWICRALPAAQLSKVVVKIRDEQWVRLMQRFNRWGFEFEKILKTLADAKDYSSILMLAEAVLAIRTPEEMSEEDENITMLNPFCAGNLEHTKVFHYLANIDKAHEERALALTAYILGEVVLVGSGEKSGNRAFPIKDMYHFSTVDFFTLEEDGGEGLSRETDVRNLAAVVKIFVMRLMGGKCDDPTFVKRIYEKYIKPLPDSETMWRLRLFVLSLCPESFKDELKQSFFKVFDSQEPPYWDAIVCAEYEQALKRGFSVLSSQDQRDYIARVIAFFGGAEKERIFINRGSKILSMIAQGKDDALTEEERERARDVKLRIDLSYEPQPVISMGRGGTVVNRAPDEDQDKQVWEGPISGIMAKLKGDWAPDKLKETYKGGDFRSPVNAEGVGERLQEKIAIRTKEYIENALLFFDRDKLHPHYTYAYLRGIQNLLREKKIQDNEMINHILNLLHAVTRSGIEYPFERKKEERDKEWWMVRWDSVHQMMAEVLKEVLRICGDELISTSRPIVFSIIQYLLAHNDPEPKHEELETAKLTVRPAGSDEELVDDPLSIAINSVRGQAFDALMLFVFFDGKRLEPQKGRKVADDVKELYQAVLRRETTQAIMFMFGQSLPSFYFREKEWIFGLISEIFNKDAGKQKLYLAAWEGYLASNLYLDMFFDLSIQKLYERAITLAPEDYPKREYRVKLDEGLAHHLSLAYMSSDEFNLESSLFTAFWKNKNIERHAEFIGFIGRRWISGRNEEADKQLKEGEALKKMMALWDWALANVEEPEVFEKFEFWINNEKTVFDNKWLAEHAKKTLEKTKGVIDWEYGLTRSLKQFAEAAPKETLEILRTFLLEAGVRARQIRVPFAIDDEVIAAFRVLYGNKETKKETYVLIDDLIREGGSLFWGLKKVMEN